jgi:hypothetical protein
MKLWSNLQRIANKAYLLRFFEHSLGSCEIRFSRHNKPGMKIDCCESRHAVSVIERRIRVTQQLRPTQVRGLCNCTESQDETIGYSRHE